MELGRLMRQIAVVWSVVGHARGLCTSAELAELIVQLL